MERTCTLKYSSEEQQSGLFTRLILKFWHVHGTSTKRYEHQAEFISTLIVHIFIAKMATLSHIVKHTEWEDWLFFQPLLDFPAWKPLLSSASAEFSVHAWHVSFPNRKKPTHVTVNCWFCNQDTIVPYGNRNCWDCPNCEQYNGFQEVLWQICLKGGWEGACPVEQRLRESPAPHFRWYRPSADEYPAVWQLAAHAEHLWTWQLITWSNFRKNPCVLGCADIEWWRQIFLSCVKGQKGPWHFHQYLLRIFFNIWNSCSLDLYFGTAELLYLGY